MKVLVTGSRDWTDYDVVYEALAASGVTILVHGDARGLDLIAERVVRDLGLDPRKHIRRYPADWTRYGRSAGPKRNQLMLDREHTPEDPIGLCLAFPLPGSIGTWDMVERVVRSNETRKDVPKIRLVVDVRGAGG